MTAISLLAIKVDTPPLGLVTDDRLLIRLEVGVHLDLSDASEETCRAMARLLLQAARVKKARTYADSVAEVAA